MPFSVASSPQAPTAGFSVFVSVLRVLCAFVVKNPYAIAFLYRIHALPAHYTPAPCSNVIHLSRHPGHQNRQFSPLPSPSISVGRLSPDAKTISMSSNVIIFIVNFHPPPSWQPTQTRSTVAGCRPLPALPHTKNDSNVGVL